MANQATSTKIHDKECREQKIEGVGVGRILLALDEYTHDIQSNEEPVIHIILTQATSKSPILYSGRIDDR